MKILVSGISFHPEHSGSAIYASDLCLYFSEQGHDVTMVTAFPFYPAWEKREEDKGKLFARDRYEGVKVLRGYLYVPKNPTAIKRMLHELSFTLFACLNFLKAGRHEVVVLSAAPLPQQLAGLFFKLAWRSQLVIHIQDLQSDAALSLGMVKFEGFIKLLAKLESFIYRNASWVATITANMQDNLQRKGVPDEKLELYPNWIAVSEIAATKHETPRGNFLSGHPQAKGKLTVAYAGNLGFKQGLEVMVDLADETRHRNDIHYFIIGEGSQRSSLEEYAASKKLDNITFLPFMSQDKYYEMLRDVDVSFVSQKAGTGDVFFPSKLLGIMAMKKPLLVAADLHSELSTVTSEAKSGLVAAPHDLETLAKNAARLAESLELRASLGNNGHEHVKRYDREHVLSRFLARLRQV